ncbi:EamA family transporter RarD [Aliiglaciecola sp. CAU 1673]|uniref:EamA family transporter RarD n=1 Tax=Aliiglaciecola sp. CAU 1673 TaxID=3032595 RepID=UPI0023DC0993|nr:EamA family transporter RarD [Aliiglaciecola sp. CAU 1673]MDF2177837.1 EamA family transporter RarD [Aliiglaciecola sp. CAU 1673]
MTDRKAQTGVLLAIAAYSMWGVAPMYFKMLLEVPAPDILLHRIVWSALILVVLVVLLGQISKVRQAVANPKVMKILLISGLLLAGNWLLFIWAVNNDHLLDASLGYYINPLLNVALGRLFLGERLRRLQKYAVGLAVAGVLILVVSFGQVPWIALALAGSFGVYGLLRKQVAVDSLPGLMLETLLMMPFAIVYWIWFASPASNMLENDMALNITLICAGIVTTAPLLCFTGAARRIMYSTLGFFQYIGPSIMFVLAVLLYNEPLHQERLLTFALVWSGLALFSFDSLRHFRQNRKAQKAALARS